MHQHSNKEQKTKVVVIFTAVIMIVEIFFGITTKSMALLADGIHMGSHVFAIGLSLIAYIFIRKNTQNKINNNKVLSLAGYSSAVLLLVFAFFILIEAIKRFFSPSDIIFKDAIIVAIVGLIVNILCAIILNHKHSDSDHNIKAAYYHVLADAFTSITAILGLLIAMYFKINWIDSICAVLSSIVIFRWSIKLIKETAKELIINSEQ